MNAKRFLLVILIFVSLAMKPHVVRAAPVNSPETFPVKVGDGDKALIAATVQIRIVPSGKGDEVQTGLGTLVASEAETFIITHNHWPAIGRSDRVQFLNAGGELLLDLSEKAFKALIIYEDPSSLVLRSPLPKDLQAARLGRASALTTKDILKIASLKGDSGGTVQLLTGRLTEITRHKDAPVFQLRLLDGETPGAGEAVGGIWFNGKLVGHTWELKPFARWSVVQLELPGIDPNEPAPSTVELLLMQPAHLLPSSFQVG